MVYRRKRAKYKLTQMAQYQDYNQNEAKKKS